VTRYARLANRAVPRLPAPSGEASALGGADSGLCICKRTTCVAASEPRIRRPMKVKGLGRTFRGVLSVGLPVAGGLDRLV
jgi:hypothetical protein